MALGKIQHLYNILYIADACVLGKQSCLPIVCHLYIFLIKVILIIERTDEVCRVPYPVLSLRLSILYLRTCVGLGYGNNYIVFLVILLDHFL
jgi:hypothetical protein